MSLRRSDREPRRSQRRGVHSAATEAARRATRARDHLERKRDQERRRREREVLRAENIPHRALVRGVFAPMLFVLAFGSGIAFARPVFESVWLPTTTLQGIDVQGASIVAPETIARRAGVRPGDSLAALDPEAIARAVETEPWVESARVLRLPSGVLVISIAERNAVARWRVDPGDPVQLVDPRGKRFAGDLETGVALPLPLVSGTNESDTLPVEALEILAEIERHRSLREAQPEIVLHLPRLPGIQTATDGTNLESQTGYVLQLGEEGPRVLLGQRLFAERVSRLAALVESREPTFVDARWIDLRYADRAVLRTEPASG